MHIVCTKDDIIIIIIINNIFVETTLLKSFTKGNLATVD